MPLPLRVVKRKGKKKFNGIVTSIKTCAPWATICAWKGVGFCIHYVMKIGQQATNGHQDYILSIFNTKIDLGYQKLKHNIFFTCQPYLAIQWSSIHEIITGPAWMIDRKNGCACGNHDVQKCWCIAYFKFQFQRYSSSTSKGFEVL